MSFIRINVSFKHSTRSLCKQKTKLITIIYDFFTIWWHPIWTISYNFSDRNRYRVGKNFKEKIVKTWLHNITDQSVKNDELSVVYKRETISLVTKNPSRNEECYVIYVMETRSRNDQACTPSERLDHFVAFYCTSTYIHPDTHTRSPT